MPRGTVHVSGYTRSNGTRVAGYTRSSPSSSKTIRVGGYTRSDGTHVKSHTRSLPSKSISAKSGRSISVNLSYRTRNANFIFSNISNNETTDIKQIINENVGNKEINQKVFVIFPDDMNEGIKKNLYCPISCQILMIPVKTNCNHIFNQTHISEWVKENDTCPLCREEIFELDDLSGDDDISINLQKIMIEFDNKKMPHNEFVKKYYCCEDDIETMTVDDD